MNHTITLTQEEVDTLYYVLYNCIGGSPDGPREHVETILTKLKPKNYSSCSHYSGVTSSKPDLETRGIFLEE
jgi:hypothetical protein